MAKQLTKTEELHKLIAAAKAASAQVQEAQTEAQAAHTEVARREDAAAETHVSGGDVDAALAHFHDGERILKEARIKLDGMGRKAERAAAAVDRFMRENHRALGGDLVPEWDELKPEELAAIAKVVEIEARRTDLRDRATRIVTAAGFNAQGNMASPDAVRGDAGTPGHRGRPSPDRHPAAHMAPP